MLIKVIKNWNSPNLMRQTPGCSGYWNGIRFTWDAVDECDAVIILNLVPEMTAVNCAPENVWALIQEPYVQGESDWMIKGHGQYAHVFTHYPVKSAGTKYIRCQPAVPWHVNKSYDELKSTAVPNKQKSISWITSNLRLFPGHDCRMDFLNFLRSQDLAIDLYGKGINYIEDKWDGLAPYRYSLAIENSSGPDYWTEKLADCFLSWTVPIYYGCTNLEEYFPAKSFIRIDINQPEAALEVITYTLSTDNWEARMPALVEARNLVLERYQFFPQMQNLVDHHYKTLPKKNLVFQPYRKRYSFIRKVRGRLSRLISGK